MVVVTSSSDLRQAKAAALTEFLDAFHEVQMLVDIVAQARSGGHPEFQVSLFHVFQIVGPAKCHTKLENHRLSVLTLLYRIRSFCSVELI